MMRNIFGKESKSDTPFFIKILNFLAPMYRAFGVDYPTLRVIVETEMVMDGRQESVIQNSGWGNKKKNDEDKNTFFQSLWMYAIFSLILLFLFAIDNIVFQYTIFFSYIFVMLISTLIANFSTILLNTKDQVLIGTKPVSSRTLSAAKATHVFIYLISFAAAIAGPIVIATFFFHGILAGVLALLLVILASLWCLLLTIIIYATVLKRFNGEKLKNIIAYSQIGLSVFTIIGYQIMNQVIQIVDPEVLAIELNLQWWHVIVFPLWFVAPFGMLQDGWSMTYGIYIAFLLLGTLGIVLLYRVNNDKLEKNLQKLDSGEAEEDKRSLYETITGKWLSWDKRELGYYHFVWQLTKHEREFKTRLYPSLASILVFPAVLLFSSFRFSEGAIEESVTFIYMPYFTMLMLPMLAVSLQYSKNYKGRWIFDTSSENHAGIFLRGMIKAMTMKLIFPIYVLLSAVVIVMTGFELLPVIINGFLLIIALFFMEVKRTITDYPFSRQYNASEANQGCLATVIFFGIVIVTTLFMFLIQEFIPFGAYIVLVLLLAVDGWLLTKGFDNTKLYQL